MQNEGFTFAIMPGLKAVHKQIPDETSKDYLKFFNTQPYMAPTIMGIDLNLEEQGKHALACSMQKPLGGSMAALGDTLFWSILKPILALLCLISILSDYLTGVIITIVLYNLVQLWVRIWGFHKGYTKGPEGVLDMGRLLSVSKTGFAAYIIPFLAGIALCLGGRLTTYTFPLPIFLMIFAVSLIALRAKMDIFKIFYGIFILILIWTMLI